VIGVNLNGDLVGRHRLGEHGRDADGATSAPPEFLTRLVDQMPTALREQAAAILPKLMSSAPASPGYFEVLMTCLDIMQDQITRARLVGDPPHVMLVPRLSHIGWLEFNRAAETIAEGRTCAQQALPFLRRYL
jgi:NTE family protein